MRYGDNRFCATAGLVLTLLCSARAVAQENIAVSDVANRTAAVRVATRNTELLTEQVRANAAAVQEVLDIGLANREAGDLLREARQHAPDAEVLARRVADRERELAEARLARVRLLERRRLAEDDGQVARLTGELATLAAYLAALEAVLLAERELLTVTVALTSVLDGRMLWIRSAPLIGSSWVLDVAEGAVWLTRATAWAELRRTLLTRGLEVASAAALYTVVLGLLIVARTRLRTILPRLANSVGGPADSFLVTVHAIGITVLMTVPVPLSLGGVGALLVTGRSDPFARAVGTGLLAAAAVYLLLEAFRQTCRPAGLADAHFGWNERVRRILRADLRWLLAVEVTAAFVVATCDASDADVHRLGLGRLLFMLGALGVTVFVIRVFRPSRGVLTDQLSRAGWPWRLRRVWYGLLVLFPATLVVAAAAGYYFTATELQSRFFVSGLIVLAGFVGYSLLTRWLRVTRGRVIRSQARRRLAEQREARLRAVVRDAWDTAPSGDAIPDVDTRAVDVAAASEQTLSLLRTLVAAGVLAALWAVWNEVLPALAVLEQVAVTEPTISPTGEVLVDSVTLGSLLVALITGALTLVAARNLPSMLELAVLARFQLDPGARYAAATLTRYAVVASGVAIASRLVGIDWSRAQWVIAALGVGLGFGLQEIVANFVSGLIILFERPIRLGDTVTVGNDSGTVSRLRIRATTITDWDNKEILVPNKSFITERVVNWTLSNAVTRLLVRVGVAYGTDEATAREAIAGAVKRVPTVVDQPPPSVLFVGFGESSLDFEVRAFVGELSHRLSTLHELHVAISAALREAGIEIPFPQRDLHLRTSEVDLSGAMKVRRQYGERGLSGAAETDVGDA